MLRQAQHRGYLLLVLHAHLPYIRHPEHEYFLEENWLYEAQIETYIPLLDLLERLINDKVNFRLTLSLSPTLVEMFKDSLLQRRFLSYLLRLIELTEKEILRTKKDAELSPISKLYNERLKRIRYIYEEHFGSDLVSRINWLSQTDSIEIITTSATHAYLPNLSVFPDAVRAQISLALSEHKRNFSVPSKGMWLPECGYYEGLDLILKENNIGFFFMEGHGILHGKPCPSYSVFKPVRCTSGVVAFGRDSASSKEVWSRTEGYPGDPFYRDFYKDIGFGLPMRYLRPYIHPCGIRIPTGIKYYRIGGKRKKPYVRNMALKRAEVHANDFVMKRKSQIEDLNLRYKFNPIITASYDAELFGHWWFEGIDWLEYLLRRLHHEDAIKSITASEYLREDHDLETVSPAMSSWGRGGYGDTWCSPRNNWAVRHVHMASRRMSELLKRFPQTDNPLLKRTLNQALRELLLMQASDWLFMIETGTSPHYGEERLHLHIKAFGRLYDMAMKGKIEEEFVLGLESKNNIFPFIDYRVYTISQE
ncbi:MAG: DUF1957 domain-containing protein [Nitrospirae bacterium]|nr:DUF1957 domain-containing protein [Nitrospirota bacterium]